MLAAAGQPLDIGHPGLKVGQGLVLLGGEGTDASVELVADTAYRDCSWSEAGN